GETAARARTALGKLADAVRSVAGDAAQTLGTIRDQLGGDAGQHLFDAGKRRFLDETRKNHCANKLDLGPSGDLASAANRAVQCLADAARTAFVATTHEK